MDMPVSSLLDRLLMLTVPTKAGTWHGANESGHMARVQWDDGQVDEVLLVDGYYLILREAFANGIYQFQVTIQDAGGRTVYENLNWQP